MSALAHTFPATAGGPPLPAVAGPLSAGRADTADYPVGSLSPTGRSPGRQTADGPQSRCRFAGDPGHQCRTNTGAPTHGEQECFAETRAQLLEGATPADFLAQVIDSIDGECGWCGAVWCGSHCVFCGQNAIEPGWDYENELTVCHEHRHLAASA